MPDVPVPSTAPLPPVKDEPFDPLKMELDEDEIDFEPEKLNNDLEVRPYLYQAVLDLNECCYCPGGRARPGSRGR